MKREIHKSEEVTLVDSREISEDARQKYKERGEAAKAEALEGLKNATEGFAVFYLTKSGVEVIMAGEMNLEGTMKMLEALRETCETVMEGVAEQLHSHLGRKGGKHGQRTN